MEQKKSWDSKLDLKNKKSNTQSKKNDIYERINENI